jgi:hypothetical protein
LKINFDPEVGSKTNSSIFFIIWSSSN